MVGLTIKRSKSQRGAAILGLAIVLFFFLLMCGLLAFETSRVQMAQREIVAACDAASLTGTAMLSSADISNDTAPSYPKLTLAQQNAASYAQNMLLMGSVLGQSLAKATNVLNVTSIGQNIQAGASQYVVGLADPTNNYASVSAGNLKGKSISCYLGYGYQPYLLSAIGITTVATITGSSYGGLPQVDAVLVFDYSASMDDQTVVTFVRREWIHDTVHGAGNWTWGDVASNSVGCGIIQYVSLTCPSSPHTIANYLQWNYDTVTGAQGSAVNALPPQNLQAAANDPNGNIGNNMNFDMYLRTHYPYGDSNYTLGGSSGYQAYPPTISPWWVEGQIDYSAPPGNCDLNFAIGGNGDGVSSMYSLGTGSNTVPWNQVVPNAFTDMTWQSDAGTTFNYEPAAPGARAGVANNDALPSSDQQTFTDLVVNIAPPNTAGPSGSATSYPYQQPLNGPDTFSGFTWTFDPLEPDTQLAGNTFSFPNIAIVVEAARGNLEATIMTNTASGGYSWEYYPCYPALIDRPVNINGTVTSSALTSMVTLTAGYQKAYARLAMMFSQPIATAMLGADQGFFQKLHLLADSCFGLVGFSSQGSIESTWSTSTGYFTTQGTDGDTSVTPQWGRSFFVGYPPYGNPLFGSPAYYLGNPTCCTFTNPNTFSSLFGRSIWAPTMVAGVNDFACNDQAVYSNNASGAIAITGYGFRVPRVQLSATAPSASDPDQYFACTSQSPTGVCWSNIGNNANGLYNGSPQSLTDTAEALTSARLMFHSTAYNITQASLSRPASRKIIVFFTDGEPTGGITGTEAQNTQAIAGVGAGTCAGDGIAVYTIGLNVSNNSTLTSDQLTFLGENGNGLTALAGNGGQFYPCNSAQDVVNAFSAVARRLTQGQR